MQVNLTAPALSQASLTLQGTRCVQCLIEVREASWG